MRSVGKGLNFVFLDLSKLEAHSAAALLAEWDLPQESCCHWIVSPSRGAELLAMSGAGPEFLRNRLAAGDRLFGTNPTGFDWNHLFPSETEAELKALETLSAEAFLFLENTPEAPAWLGERTKPLFRATPRGLCVHQGNRSLCLPWATRDRQPSPGVWWVLPGQVLLGALPPPPWSDLFPALPSLLDRRNGLGLPAEPPRSFSPSQKKALHSIALHRRASAATPHQSILFRSQDYPGLGTRDAVDFEEALGGIRKRSLVANMQGQTDLSEAGLKVRFQGGRLVRIDDALSGTVLCTGTESSLDWGGSRHLFQVNSAFSFEGDYSWGLRQSLVLEHDDLAEPGRAIFDFYFVEESREFFIAATVRWPKWKSPVTVTRWSPLELSLFDLSLLEPLTSRVVWPDGRRSDHIHRGESTGVLEGTDFVFAAGKRALALGFPQNQTPRPHALPWRLVRGWGKARLVLNPEGGQHPTPSTEFEGIEEHFSLYLTLADRAKFPFSVTRKQAIELIPPYVVDADDDRSHS